MATNEASFCTDEEILQELKKLGYNDIPADAFLMMKKDLSELVVKDQNISYTTLKIQSRQSPFRDKKYPSQTLNFNQASSFLPAKPPTFIVDAKMKTQSSSDYLYLPSEILVEDDYSKYSSSVKSYNRAHSHKKLSEKDSSEESDISSDALKVENSQTGTNIVIGDTTSFSKYKERLKNFKAGRLSKSIGLDLVNNGESSSNSSSVSLEGNKIKRKVLRHKNGKPVITEEFLEIPSIFNTSYPETENSDVPKSISSDELSFNSNSSSGSTSIASPDSSETPRSTVLSTRSVQTRASNQRKKKSDPVAMYNYYKKFWNDFKPPGEKTHDKLRWAVRDRMLDYTL